MHYICESIMLRKMGKNKIISIITVLFVFSRIFVQILHRQWLGLQFQIYIRAVYTSFPFTHSIPKVAQTPQYYQQQCSALQKSNSQLKKVSQNATKKTMVTKREKEKKNTNHIYIDTAHCAYIYFCWEVMCFHASAL